ncbi:MAG: replication factor C large subunit [Candidatus Diapherotrites archaeon]
MADLWTDKYSPKTPEEFVGNSEILAKALDWANGWGQGKKQSPLLLWGQTGSGKTLLAYLIAKLQDWEMFELNASDFRSKDIIERIAGAAAANASFSGKKRLVLIDELDGLHGTKDRGGAGAIASVIRQAQNPMILTANDIYSNRNISSLRFACTTLEFKKINYLSIAKRLREILDGENAKYDPEAVKELAKNSGGDFRSALLDLQTLAMEDEIGMKEVQSMGGRERSEKIFTVMKYVFKGKDLGEIRKARMASDLSNDLLQRWVEENIPRQYSGADMAKAFDRFSRSDIFNGRIRRMQYWGFLRYSSELMTSGIAFSRENDYSSFVPYQFPTLLSKLSKSRPIRELKKGLGRKVGKQIHSSARDVMAHDLPFMQMLFEQKELAPRIAAQFDLNEKEVAFLMNTKPETKKVQKVIEEAAELRTQNITEKRSIFRENFSSKEKIEEKPEEESGNQTKLF